MFELKNALAKLETDGRTINVFFRNDDVDVDEPTLRQMLYTFWLLKAPLNLAVIPGRLTEACITLLKQYDRSQFDLHQHGWQHFNHETIGRKCEFGVSRSYEQQLKDIAKGQQRMSEAFRHNWTHVFTPPWNRCTEETYRALDQLGFKALSKDNSDPLTTGHGFREIPVTLDLYNWTGKPAMKSPETIVSELTAQTNKLSTIGILLHHKVMGSTALAFLEQLLETLVNCPNVRVLTFQSLLHI